MDLPPLFWVWVGTALALAVVLVFRARRRRLAPLAAKTDEAAWLKFYEIALRAMAEREARGGVDPVLLAVRTTRSAAGYASAALEVYRDRWPSSSVTSPAATSAKTPTTPPGKRPPPPGPGPTTRAPLPPSDPITPAQLNELAPRTSKLYTRAPAPPGPTSTVEQAKTMDAEVNRQLASAFADLDAPPVVVAPTGAGGGGGAPPSRPAKRS